MMSRKADLAAASIKKAMIQKRTRKDGVGAKSGTTCAVPSSTIQLAKPTLKRMTESAKGESSRLDLYIPKYVEKASQTIKTRAILTTSSRVNRRWSPACCPG